MNDEQKVMSACPGVTRDCALTSNLVKTFGQSTEQSIIFSKFKCAPALRLKINERTRTTTVFMLSEVRAIQDKGTIY